MAIEPAIAAHPHVVIVGAGFGGLPCAKRLGGAPFRVTVIDRRNYHLFVPLLYQVATAALSPADIAQPIRRLLRRYQNIDVVLGEVTGVDVAGKRVLLEGESPIAYDRLVVATGSTYNYFGHGEWARVAPGPKNLEDARTIRARLLLAFEKAEISTDPAEQAALLTTVIVGGGPTGVEMAGAVAELTRHALKRDFRHIDTSRARILLVESGPRVLGTFPPELADYARQALEKLGVTVLTNQRVEDIQAGQVTISGRVERAGCVIWGAGVQASPAAAWLGVHTRPQRADRGRSGSLRPRPRRRLRRSATPPRRSMPAASRCRRWPRSPTSRASISVATSAGFWSTARRCRPSASAAAATRRSSAGTPRSSRSPAGRFAASSAG